jgi:GTP-binding protein
MKYQFVKSSSDWKMCPDGKFPEVAFIGRSNVGKSSLINSILGTKSAAKTSSTPGKTQLINHFLINDSWYLVDLPGYGYAKVSQTERVKWEKMVRDYLKNRKELVLLMVLIDSRIPPQKSDLEFLQFAGKNGLPLCIVFTKADKQSAGKTKAAVEAFSLEMRKDWEDLPGMAVSSAVTGLGKDELMEAMSVALENFQNQNNEQ